jgi:hypothetical protein
VDRLSNSTVTGCPNVEPSVCQALGVNPYRVRTSTDDVARGLLFNARDKKSWCSSKSQPGWEWAGQVIPLQ